MFRDGEVVQFVSGCNRTAGRLTLVVASPLWLVRDRYYCADAKGADTSRKAATTCSGAVKSIAANAG